MKHLLSLVFMVVLFGCKTPDSLSESENERIIVEVKQTLASYYADIEKSGLVAEFSYLDSSDSFFWVPPGYGGPISYDSVVSTLKLNAAKFKLVKNHFDTIKINPVSINLAIYTGKLSSTMIDTSGKSSSFKLLETGVLIKRGMEWKLLSGQTTLLK